MCKNHNIDKLPSKKGQLLNSATVLFCSHGFRRITIDEICRTAQVSKMTFYKYFKNKVDIAKQVLDHIYEQGKVHYYDMLKQNIPFSLKIEKILLISRSQTQAIGQSFFEDLMNTDLPLNAHFNKKQDEIKQMTINFCRDSQKNGYIRNDIDIDVMMFMLNVQHEQVNHPDFIKAVPKVEDRCSILASLFFYGFTGVSQ